MAKSKRDPEQEKARRDAARKFYSDNPTGTPTELRAYLEKAGVKGLASGKTFSVWANNQRTATGGKSVRKSRPNPLQEATTGREITEMFGSTDKALKMLEAVKKLGSVSNAIRAVKKWDAVLKAAGNKPAVAMKFMEAIR